MCVYVRGGAVGLDRWVHEVQSRRMGFVVFCPLSRRVGRVGHMHTGTHEHMTHR